MTFRLSRLEKSVFACLLALALGALAALLNRPGTGLALGGGTAALGALWIWRPQGRDVRGRFTLKGLPAALLLLLAGCQSPAWAPTPTAPGRITQRQDTQRWQFAPAPPAMPMVLAWPANTTAPITGPTAGTLIILPAPAAPLVPFLLEDTHQEHELVQPESPAGEARLDTHGFQTLARLPPAYPPVGPPVPATPAQQALGGLVWLGAGLMVLGILGVGLRFLPWTAGLGAVIPIGVSVLVALAGGLLIASATVLASAPWWVTGLCVAAIVGVAFLIALRDNWQRLFGASAIPALPPASLTP